MRQPIIKFENFSFKYQSLQEYSLKSINLEIFEGEKVLITGRSGSGKSTLLHCLNGIIPFANGGNIEGKLTISDIQPHKMSIFEISKKVGTILQDQDSQFIGMSVGEDTAFSMENDAVRLEAMKKKVVNCLRLVGMEKFLERNPYELSGGQKQRVSLAGILTSSPEILVFDEPLANLDPASGKNVVKLIKEINKTTDKTIVVVEHRIEEMLECGIDKVVVVDNGQIVKIGKPSEILSSGIFEKLGIREPLYIDVMRYAGVDIAQENISDLSSAVNSINDNIKNKIASYSSSSQVNATPIKKQEPEIALKIDNVSFSYDKKKPVLKNISFEIKKGEIVTVLGNNGTGKSTLSFLINGILKPDCGKIFLGNEDITHWSLKKRGQEIGLIMQNPNSMIVKGMIQDELELGLKSLGHPKDTIIKEVEATLKICELWPYRNWPVSALSYGQKKRVTIGSILTLSPKVIIMDEPTAGQDLMSYKLFMKFVKSPSAQGIAIILITHDLYLAVEYSTRSIVIADGEKIADDKPCAIFTMSDVLKKANLKELSLTTLADTAGIDRETLISRFIESKRAAL